ncbi:3-hydroxyisobutyrate dehydrogenase-like beta-hydroxyacid dehydrogenase [Paraburkholderia sp. GAS32]
MAKVGFIGLGVMGAPMAANLQQGGHQLFVHDRNPAPAGLIENGATLCESGKAVAQQADIVILMVPDTPHVESVLFGENGAASGLRANQIVVDMSSISPIATKQFASKINELGCQYLDAPVSQTLAGSEKVGLPHRQVDRRAHGRFDADDLPDCVCTQMPDTVSVCL